MSKKIFITIASVNLALVLVQLGLSAKRATAGDALDKINQQVAQIELENQDLRNQILKESALEKIESKAAFLQLTHVKLGFMNLNLPVAAAR